MSPYVSIERVTFHSMHDTFSYHSALIMCCIIHVDLQEKPKHTGALPRFYAKSYFRPPSGVTSTASGEVNWCFGSVLLWGYPGPIDFRVGLGVCDGCFAVMDLAKLKNLTSSGDSLDSFKFSLRTRR